MRRNRLTFAVVAALSAFALGAGTLAAPVLAAPSDSSNAGPAGAMSSAPGGKKKAAKKKALRKCGKKRSAKQRKTCRKNVNRRFHQKPVEPVVPADPVAIIDVRDDYFSPNVVSIKSGDSIQWVWYDINHDPHNITPTSLPEGVDRGDFQTSLSPASRFTFTRKFVVPGTYTFACSLHVHQTMTVVVS